MIGDTIVTIVLSSYLSAAGDYAALYRGEFEPQYVQSVWKTHPYWESRDFWTGNICFDGNVYTSVPMRYDVYANALSVTMPESQYVVMPKQDQVAWFEVDGVRFQRANDWFMRVEYQGKNLALLLKRSKLIAPDVLIDRHWYHDLKTLENYYVLTPDGLTHEVSSLKSLCRLYPGHKEELRRIAKQEHLKFSRNDLATSLITCLKAVDQSEMAVDGDALVPVYRVSDEDLLPVAYNVEPVDSVKRVSAYYVYQTDSHGRLEYADDDTENDTPGISQLEPISEARTLDEVEVMGMRQKLSQQFGGVESFRPQMLRNVPQAMGEADVLKLAMLTPGVSTTGEASSGLNVRGGSTDQNLMLFNGNTIYNPMHLFGMFSAFNADLIAESELYKGNIPSEYGGRLSSVMNIKGRTADRQKFHGSASIGLITSNGVFDIPIIKNRVSLLVGGRGTYSDWMLKLLPKENGKEDGNEELSDYRNGNAGFWDLGGTLSIGITKPTNRKFMSTLLLHGYYSDDRFALTEYEKYAYSNQNYSMEWRNRFGERVLVSLQAGLDHYDYTNDETQHHYSAARLSFDLNQYFAKLKADFKLHERYSINIGAQATQYDMMPGEYQPLGEDSQIVPNTLPQDKAMESAVWFENDWSITRKLKLTAGARMNLFQTQEKANDVSFQEPDWRASLSYSFNDFSSFKLGYNTMHQFIHKVSNTLIMSPTDTWVLSNEFIKPQSGWQGSTGIYTQSRNRQYELSIEAYYKEMQNFLTYRGGAMLIMNPKLHEDVIGANGRAYGIEVQVRKLYGKLNGWISYTYSRTQLRQDAADSQFAINNGEWFSTEYDVPHNLKVVGNYKFTRRFSTSVNVDYSTGRPFTAPVAQFNDPITNVLVPVYSERNSVRMPDYCRVDWSFNIEPGHRLTAKTRSWFTIGVYNLTGRKNAYSIYYESDGKEIKGYKLSIFGSQIPYLNYNIKF